MHSSKKRTGCRPLVGHVKDTVFLDTDISRSSFFRWQTGRRRGGGETIAFSNRVSRRAGAAQARCSCRVRRGPVGGHNRTANSCTSRKKKKCTREKRFRRKEAFAEVPLVTGFWSCMSPHSSLSRSLSQPRTKTSHASAEPITKLLVIPTSRLLSSQPARQPPAVFCDCSSPAQPSAAKERENGRRP